MKNLILVGIILFGIMSCNSEQETTTQTTTESIPNDDVMRFHYGDIDVYRIQEIDGCEYIVINGKANEQPALTHKGNCKYCLERSKQQQKEEEY